MTQFRSLAFTNPEFKLVTIHPEHFLPNGSVLPIYHSTDQHPTLYFSASDRQLRTSTSSHSRRLPTFHHNNELRNGNDRLNIFLVVLNAEIKFRRYLSMISQNPPTTPLPPDVLSVMRDTVHLVN